MVKSNQPLQIRLTEPVIFLRGPSTGFDLRGRPQLIRNDGPPAMLRGLLTLRLSKPTKIRSIAIKLTGKARTEWPEGESEAPHSIVRLLTLSRRRAQALGYIRRAHHPGRITHVLFGKGRHTGYAVGSPGHVCRPGDPVGGGRG